MEFKKLKIHNIASIADAEIDFESGPLAEEPLFLICGETGSGKSTILDAVCLALYRKTPRLSSNSTKEKIVDGGNNAVGIFDTAQIMRQNTGSASVSLDFRGADGNHYTARWSVRRAYGRPDGKIQDDRWSLEDHTSGKIFEKKKDDETDAVMEKAVGLTFDQFCRTVMLAQGEFTRFLKSNDNEKSGILEKLTGTERYSDIGRAVYEIYKARETACNNQKIRLEGIKILPEEEAAAIRSETERLERDVMAYRSEMASVDSKLTWLRSEEECRKESAEKKSAVDDAEKKIRSDLYKTARQNVNDWRASSQVRQYMKCLKDAEHKKGSLIRELACLKEREAGLLAWNGALSAETDRLAGRLGSAEKYFSGISAIVPMLEKGVQIADVLQMALSERKKAEKAGKDAADRQAGIRGLENDLAVRSRALSDAESKVRDKQAEIKAVEAKAAEFDRDRINSAVEAAGKFIQEVSRITAKSEELHRIHMELKSESAALEGKQSALNTSASEARNMKERLEKAKKREDEERLAYGKQEKMVSDWAREMRSRLVPGDICPVCGQEVHAVMSDEEFSSLLEIVRKRYDAARMEAEALRTSALQAEAGRQRIEDEIRDMIPKLEEKKKRYSEESVALMNAFEEKILCLQSGTGGFSPDKFPVPEEAGAICIQWKGILSGNCPNDAMDEMVSGAAGLLNDMQKNAERIQDDAREQRKILDNLDSGLKILHKHLLGLLAEKENASKEKLAAENKLSDTLKDIGNLKKNTEEYMASSAARLVAAAQDILIPGWQQEWQASPERLIDDIRGKADLYARSLKEKNKLEDTLKMVQKSYAAVSGKAEEFAAEVERCPYQDSVQDGFRGTVQDKCRDTAVPPSAAGFSADMLLQKENEWSRLLADGAAFAARSAENEESMMKFRTSAEEFFASRPEIDRQRIIVLEKEMNDDMIAEQETAAENIESALRQAHAEYEAVCRRHAGLMESRPDFSENEDRTALERRRSDLERLVSESDRSIGARKRQLEQNDLNLKEKQAELSVLASLVREMDEWKGFSTIFGDSKGVTFRKIAQAFILKQILRGANRYLGRFSSRYELDCQPGQLTILIRDLYQGNSLRPFSTLSGGECFIVSLALALGLSSMVKGDGAVDILFIDEGFGTLSEEHLNMVMNSLSRLHESGGKRVGVISHVELLRERIPVQIRLVRQDNTSSRVEVVRI